VRDKNLPLQIKAVPRVTRSEAVVALLFGSVSS
jgi:hypothetical protein